MKAMTWKIRQMRRTRICTSSPAIRKKLRISRRSLPSILQKGIPTAVNGKKMDGVELVNTLNAIGARNGIGIDDLVENRLVGMKFPRRL